MNIVSNKDQILDNVDLFFEVLELGKEEEQDSLMNLIIQSQTFLVLKVEDIFLFSPSYFIGFQDQSMERFVAKDFSETITNEAISKALGSTPKIDKTMDENFLDFCDELGINRNDVGVSRDYWILKTF